MYRMTLATLVLVPVLAHAAVGKLAETPAAITSMSASSSHAAVKETVREQFSGDFLEAALRQGGTLEYSMKGSVPLETSAPRITKAVEVELTQQELSEQPSTTNVIVKAIVDENGIPRNVAVKQSAGSLIDAKAIAAVSQYRFKPATIDNQPTWAAVEVTIKIQKQ